MKIRPGLEIRVKLEEREPLFVGDNSYLDLKDSQDKIFLSILHDKSEQLRMLVEKIGYNKFFKLKIEKIEYYRPFSFNIVKEMENKAGRYRFKLSRCSLFHSYYHIVEFKKTK